MNRANGGGVHVLVVDDEPDVRNQLSAWLTAGGFDCTTAEDPEAALGSLAGATFDVAVLDLIFPRGDGVTLARTLRAAYADIGIVLVSGTPSFSRAIDALRIGAVDYLLKPFSQRDLLEAVRRGVSRRRVVDGGPARSAEQARRPLEIRRDGRAPCPAALEALLVTLGRRDPEGLAHSRRVARLAIQIGLAMEFSDHELDVLWEAGLLHDVGKIAMPDAIVGKPGPLSAGEIALMRRHVEIGYDIIVVVPSLRHVAEIVLGSHENFDGSGYPRGLVGREAPAGSRILRVADVFDALTTVRAYHRAVTVSEANAELVRGAGTRFDPDIVNVWLRVSDGWPEIMPDGDPEEEAR